MPASNFVTFDPIFGILDLDNVLVTNSFLVDQFVGNRLFTTGNNAYGQLGLGNIINYSSPIQVGSLNNWRQIAVGASMMAGIDTNYKLWVWGGQGLSTITNAGQLGNGTIVNYSSPVQVGALTTWKQVSCGYRHTAAVKTDGTLWNWGANGNGQLGNGTLVSYSSPIQVGSLTNWKLVVAAGVNNFAIKNDGTLWTVGSNLYGQLGNGTLVYYSSPIQVGSLTNWMQVAGGSYPNFPVAAIKTDGTLWTWGSGAGGGLGNGTTTYYSSPIQIGSLTNWMQVAVGSSLYAIKTDGTLWACGYNTQGQLGNGTTVNYSSPIQIGSLNNWKTISAYGVPASTPGFPLQNTGFALATKTDGTLWAWGYNSSGQFGNGTTVNYSSPIQIGTLNSWKQVSGSYFNTAAIPFMDI
jgi:alpha-tubulin suppressor-like RCC1 family protein